MGCVIELESNRIVWNRHIKRKKHVLAERLLSKIVVKCGKHHVSSGEETWYPPQVCRFLNLKHHLHFFF